jgi:hypothetical protein|tara:strand:- start:106 stop:396 length:291 start_codon:yes stop_codon:yes gene_type:complete
MCDEIFSIVLPVLLLTTMPEFVDLKASASCSDIGKKIPSGQQSKLKGGKVKTLSCWGTWEQEADGRKSCRNRWKSTIKNQNRFGPLLIFKLYTSPP